jgi:acyl-CoA thioesterase I
MRLQCGVAGLFLALALVTGPALAQPVHILPIGDSITQGRGTSPQTQSWRYPFWKLLVDSGTDFDMIGSLSVGFNGDPDWPDYMGLPFDRDHDGHWGWTSWGCASAMQYWIPNWDAPPDVAMFLLGTNASGEDDAIPHNVAAHRDMFNQVRDENPNVIIMLGLPFQEWNPFPAMRDAYRALAAEESTPQSPIVVVDHSPGWVSNPGSPGTHTVDWVHPNTAGDLKLAQNWYAAFTQLPDVEPPVPGDLNHDGVVGIADIDRMFLALRNGNPKFYYDLNDDGEIDQTDADYLLHTLAGSEYGDANGDGQVSDADYTVWADNYGATDATWSMGDFSNNGNVTEADYTIWADHYGFGAGDASVPEPTGLAVAAIACLSLRRRRVRSRAA